jgi:hypothetical protein
MIMIIYKLNKENQPEYMISRKKNKKENCLTLDLKAGEYLVEVRPNLCSSVDSFALTCYGPGSVSITQTNYMKLNKPNQDACLVEGVLAFSSENQMNKRVQVGKYNLEYILKDLRHGMGYMIIENNEESFDSINTINFSESTNVRIAYPPNQTNLEMTITVNRGSKKTIVLLAEELDYKIKMKISSKFKDFQKEELKKKEKKKLMQEPEKVPEKKISETKVE